MYLFKVTEGFKNVFGFSLILFVSRVPQIEQILDNDCKLGRLNLKSLVICSGC